MRSEELERIPKGNHGIEGRKERSKVRAASGDVLYRVDNKGSIVVRRVRVWLGAQDGMKAGILSGPLIEDSHIAPRGTLTFTATADAPVHFNWLVVYEVGGVRCRTKLYRTAKTK